MKLPYFTIDDSGWPCLDGVPLPCVTEYNLVVPEHSEGSPTLTVKILVSMKVRQPPERTPIHNLYEYFCAESVVCEQRHKSANLDPETGGSA